MLAAATAMVNQTGLTVSLEHISFEDVIRDARVSRSTVYRRWPYKDLFFSDLLKELAKATTPAAISRDEDAAALITGIVLDRLDWLRTPQGRTDLVLELIRRGSVRDFETMLGSTEWRTYLALHATFMSVADEALRADLQVALARSEADFVARIAAEWQRLTGLLGYRLKPEMDATFGTLATIASADLRGHVITALANPELATRRVTTRPFGASQAAEWSIPALSLACVAMAFLEPDPAVEWNDARIATIREALMGA